MAICARRIVITAWSKLLVRSPVLQCSPKKSPSACGQLGVPGCFCGTQWARGEAEAGNYHLSGTTARKAQGIFGIGVGLVKAELVSASNNTCWRPINRTPAALISHT